MTLRRLLILVTLVGVMAIFLVYEQSRITRAGYRISELSHEEAGLVEQVRILHVQVTKLRQPEVIEQRVEQMSIGLMRPPEAGVLPVSTASRN